MLQRQRARIELNQKLDRILHDARGALPALRKSYFRGFLRGRGVVDRKSTLTAAQREEPQAQRRVNRR